MRGALLVSSLIMSIWLSLLAVLLFVERVIMLIPHSATRSIVGLSTYFIWLAAWYFLIKKVFEFLLSKASSPKGGRG